jgi:hypothetical protein
VEIINKYDSTGTFMYLDPPYNSVEKKGSNDDVRSSWYGTKDEFGQKDHITLLKLLKTTKSRWALSYYYYPELEEYLPKDKYTWITKDFFRSSASFSETKSEKGTELLILNYDPKHISSNSTVSEKLVDEIEEMNNGAFITSKEETEIFKEMSNISISRFVDDGEDYSDWSDVNSSEKISKKGLKDVLYSSKITNPDEFKPEVKPDEDIDDFWK